MLLPLVFWDSLQLWVVTSSHEWTYYHILSLTLGLYWGVFHDFFCRLLIFQNQIFQNILLWFLWIPSISVSNGSVPDQAQLSYSMFWVQTVCKCYLIYIPVNNLSVMSRHFLSSWVEPVLKAKHWRSTHCAGYSCA